MFEAMQAIIQALISLNLAFNGAGGIFNTLMNMEIPDVVESAVTAAGVSLATTFLAMELFSKMAEFRVERIEDAIRIAMKLVVCKIILENTATISKGIYQMFGGLGKEHFGGSVSSFITKIIGALNRGSAELVNEIDKNAFKSFMNMGSVLEWLGYVAIFAIVFALLCSLAFTIIGVVFEVAIHQAMAPVALSTLVNDTARSTGISFIKSYSAVCLQFLVIKVIFKVGAGLNETLNSLFDLSIISEGTLFRSTLLCLPSVLGLFMVIAAVKKSGEITKRLLGA